MPRIAGPYAKQHGLYDQCYATTAHGISISRHQALSLARPDVATGHEEHRPTTACTGRLFASNWTVETVTASARDTLSESQRGLYCELCAAALEDLVSPTCLRYAMIDVVRSNNVSIQFVNTHNVACYPDDAPKKKSIQIQENNRQSYNAVTASASQWQRRYIIAR